MNKGFWLDRYTKLKENKIVGSMSYGDEYQYRVDDFFNKIKGTLSPIKANIVLDYGCGTAKYAKLLNSFFGGKYIGYDIIDFVMKDNAEKLPEFTFTNKITGLPKKADVIWMASLMQHMDDNEAEETLKRFHKILNKTGSLYITDCVLKRVNDSYTYFRGKDRHIVLMEQAGFNARLIYTDDVIGVFECKKLR